MESLVKNTNKEIRAVSFDVDGTLYSLKKLKMHVVLRSPRDIKFYLTLEKERKKLRHLKGVLDLEKRVAAVVAKKLGLSLRETEDNLKRIFEQDWPRLLSKLSVPKAMPIFIQKLIAQKIIIGVLSDYPSRKKIDALGLGGLPWSAYTDCTAFGFLKPNPESFLEFSKAIKIPPENILHVGDRQDLDILGASLAGMKTLLIGPIKSKDLPSPDFHFLSFKKFYKALCSGWWIVDNYTQK